MKTYMKQYFFVLTAAVALFFTSCKEDQYINSPGDNAYNRSLSESAYVPDTSCMEISVDSALTICKSMAVNAESSTMFKLSGVVVKNTTNPMSVPGQYDNINFDLSDNGGKTSISCFYTNNVNNRPFRKNSDVPRVGSKVTVVGTLTLYQKSGSTNTPTPELKNGFIVRIDSMVAPPPFPGCPDPEAGEISVSEAVRLALQLEDKTESEESYNIKGVVTEVLSIDVSSYGNAEYIISDGQQYFYVYRGKGLNGNNFTKKEQLLPNDTVTVATKLYNYGGIAETKANSASLLKTTNKNW